MSQQETKASDLVHKQPGRQRTFKIPDLISDRLDDLCHVLNEDGAVGEIRRQNLIAALVALAPEDVEALEKLINTYRNKTVGESLVGKKKGAEVIELREVVPGRRAY